jgi:two-component system KDP operon response regulator KdpE
VAHERLDRSHVYALGRQAGAEEEQTVKALRAGADDYLTKPFATKELLARLAAIFRRVVANSDEASLTINGLEINFAARRVLHSGREVNLTPIEFELLCLLARNRGRPMSSRALLTQIWGADHADDTPLLRTHIANLRGKMEEHPTRWRYIKTQSGGGYRFCD